MPVPGHPPKLPTARPFQLCTFLSLAHYLVPLDSDICANSLPRPLQDVLGPELVPTIGIDMKL